MNDSSEVAKSLSIREVHVSDADSVAKLTGELGYPVSSAEITQRITTLLNMSGRAVFVAALNGEVVGWIDVAVVYHLASGAFAEIDGLVVSATHRSAGIGRELVKSAEQWVRLQGVTKMLVRSRISREAAHRFYLRAGFSQIKTSAVFTKSLE